MPAHRFTVHVDPDDLAQQDLAASLSRPSTGDRQPDRSSPSHHGAGDARQAARQRSGRDRAGRASGAGGGRSYAFRRS